MMNDLPGLTVSAPLFFHQDGSIDYVTLERYLCDVCKNRHISAVYSMAYNTRYRMLDDCELLDLNRMIIELVTDFGHDVYVGHPYSFTECSLDRYLSKISQLNVAGISMLYPERYYGIYNPIIEFLKFPQNFDLPVVLHEMKLISGFNGELINWPLGLLDEILNEIGLVGIKEDSKDDKIA